MHFLSRTNIFLFFLLAPFFTPAQDPVVDSLNHLLKNARHDTLRLRLLTTLSEVCAEEEIESYARPAIALADSILQNTPPFKNAVLRYKGAALNNIGFRKYNIGDINSALEFYHLALGLREKTGDELGVANSLNNIAAIYLSQGLVDKALDYLLKAQGMMEKLGDSLMLASALNNIGVIYIRKGMYRKSLEYHNKGLKLQEALGNSDGVAHHLLNIGYAWMSLGDHVQALGYYQRSYEIRKKLGHQAGMAASLVNIGHVFLKERKLPVATGIAKEALSLAREVKYPEFLKNALELISLVDSANGNHEDAYLHYREYMLYRDSITNEETRKAGLRTQLEYEFRTKEDRLRAEQEKRDAIAEGEKQRQQVILWVVGSGLFLVLVFAIFMLRSYLQKRKANIAVEQQKEVIEMKQKEILDSIYYARRIQRSLLTHERYIERQLEKLRIK